MSTVEYFWLMPYCNIAKKGSLFNRRSLVYNITSKCIIDNVYSVSWKYVRKFNIHWTINMPTIINSDLSNWNCQYLLHFYFGIILVEIIWSEGGQWILGYFTITIQCNQCILVVMKHEWRIIIVTLRQGSGKDKQGFVIKRSLKASERP